MLVICAFAVYALVDPTGMTNVLLFISSSVKMRLCSGGLSLLLLYMMQVDTSTTMYLRMVF